MTPTSPPIQPPASGDRPTIPPAVRATQTLSCGGQTAAPTLHYCCSPACPGYPWPASQRPHPCPPGVEPLPPLRAKCGQCGLVLVGARTPCPVCTVPHLTLGGAEDPRDLEHGEDRRTHVPPRRRSRAAVLRAYADAQFALMLQQQAARAARQLAGGAW